MSKLFTRRAFLVTSGAAGVATMLARADRALGAAGSGVAGLSRSTFEPLVGSRFRLIAGGASQAVVLETVSDIAPTRSGNSDRTFGLIFRGTKKAAWPQGMYVLQHRAIGRIRLLVVPVDRGVDARRYQIIVNGA
jgi:hypothetical protein